MSKGFARLHIRQVHLHHREWRNAAHRVAERHRGVGESPRVEHHAEQVRFVGRDLQAIDEHPLVVALQMVDVQHPVVAAAQFVDDIRQRRATVDLRFAAAEKIEVGPVEHQHARQGRHKQWEGVFPSNHRRSSGFSPQNENARLRQTSARRRKRADRLESTDYSSYICAQKYEISMTCANRVVQNL